MKLRPRLPLPPLAQVVQHCEEAILEALVAVLDATALLHDPQEEVRAAAAGLFELLGEPAAPHAADLAALLRDAAKTVRQAAAKALGRLGDAGAALPVVAEVGLRKNLYSKGWNSF